jgi:predicted transcriptional regulator
MGHHGMPAPSLDKLSRREREIMDALFASPDGASAEAVRAAMSDPPSYSAVRTMLVRLEAKGYVRHRTDGPRYIYEPITARTTARRAALQQLVRVFFGGSPGDAASALLRQERWTDDELEALRAQIDSVRKERKRT